MTFYQFERRDPETGYPARSISFPSGSLPPVRSKLAASSSDCGNLSFQSHDDEPDALMRFLVVVGVFLFGLAAILVGAVAGLAYLVSRSLFS